MTQKTLYKNLTNNVVNMRFINGLMAGKVCELKVFTLKKE